MLRDNARFLIVASWFGGLRILPPDLHAAFNATTRSLEDIERLMNDCVHLVEAGKAEAYQWPEWISVPSKVAQVALTKILVRLMREGAPRRGIMINAVGPGLVGTDASRTWIDDMSSAQKPAQAAVHVIWLVTLPPGTDTRMGN